MIQREDMLELTRRMTLSRNSFTRIAGCYIDSEGEYDGSFNTNFLKLSASDLSLIHISAIDLRHHTKLFLISAQICHHVMRYFHNIVHRHIQIIQHFIFFIFFLVKIDVYKRQEIYLLQKPLPMNVPELSAHET